MRDARTRRVLYAESLRGALAGAATLAVLVNVVELACTAACRPSTSAS